MSISEVNLGFNIGPFSITNTMVWTWIIMAVLLVLLLWLAKGAKLEPAGTKQTVAEFLVETMNSMTTSTMGANKIKFAPYMLALIAFLALSNLSGFLFLGFVRPPTADWATTLALAVCSFSLIQGFGLGTKGIKEYVKGFFDPLPFLFPINVIGELAPIVSLSFRLFGNILGGLIITTLVYSIFVGSNAITAWTIIAGIMLIVIVSTNAMGMLKKLPKAGRTCVILVGVVCLLPVLATSFVHFYFDIFAGCMQAYIFTMLTMVLISNSMAE